MCLRKGHLGHQRCMVKDQNPMHDLTFTIIKDTKRHAILNALVDVSQCYKSRKRCQAHCEPGRAAQEGHL
jgi:hypothetical protein